eukprot:jgi/Chlat1/48/ChrspC238589S00927
MAAAGKAAAAAAAATRAAVLPTSQSGSVQEASSKARKFFHEIARAMPAIMKAYNLENTIEAHQLLSAVADEFRRFAHVSNPKAIDMLVYKGREELYDTVMHYKQRHHLLTTWVERYKQRTQPKTSDFLTRFYQGNN